VRALIGDGRDGSIGLTEERKWLADNRARHNRTKVEVDVPHRDIPRVRQEAHGDKVWMTHHVWKTFPFLVSERLQKRSL
jgi:hypothetical protein